jgi:hypothetical protein
MQTYDEPTLGWTVVRSRGIAAYGRHVRFRHRQQPIPTRDTTRDQTL